jgi:hypothetical protein
VSVNPGETYSHAIASGRVCGGMSAVGGLPTHCSSRIMCDVVMRGVEGLQAAARGGERDGACVTASVTQTQCCTHVNSFPTWGGSGFFVKKDNGIFSFLDFITFHHDIWCHIDKLLKPKKGSYPSLIEPVSIF